MNIVLIGYRGTGKSVISKSLTDILHCRGYSLDEEITQQAGKSIREIVEQEGWVRFREIERVVRLSVEWFIGFHQKLEIRLLIAAVE